MGNRSNINIALTLNEVLIFHDVPHLFTASDKVGTRYLCLLVEDTENNFEYLCQPVSSMKLQQLLKGKLDLRTAIEQPELGFWYLVSHFEEENAFAIRTELESLPEGWLPDEGFYIPNPEGIQ